MTPRGVAILLVVVAVRSLAQVERSVPRDLIEQRIEVAAERLGDDADVDLSTLFEVLIERYQHPIDLNRTDPDELASLQLLTDVQIAGLFDHLDREGPLLSIYELQTIDAFDPASIELIRPFVEVKERTANTRMPLREVLRLAEQELMVRSVTDIQQRKGYMGQDNIFGSTYADPDGDPLPDTDDPAVDSLLRATNKVYLGSPYKLYARYRFRYRNNLSFGITAEKDEGEEFFRGSQADGFDFYSAHLFVRDVGPFKSVAIGDYQAQFGQGLTYWNGLAYASKGSYTMNIKRNAAGLLPYASVNENQFLRGVAATMALGKQLELTGFYSDRDLDANIVRGDTTDSGEPGTTFSSFQEDGLHQTTSDVQKKDALGERTIGGHLRHVGRRFSAGATVANIQYDTELLRDIKPYNQFEFNGDAITKYGADWSVLYRNLSWFGEVSAADRGGVAWLSGLLIALDRRVSLSLLYRDYPRDFLGIYSVAFAESTNPWNERGLYAGLEIKASREWTINAYFDQYRFPWLRYLTDGPSSGYDVIGQLNWKPSKKVEVYGRVRHRASEKNSEDPDQGIDPLVPVEQTNYRLNASYRVSNSVSLRTRLEIVDYQRGESPMEHGFLMYQDVVHRPLRSPLEFTFRLALFQTDSYDSRVYAYENDLIGLYSIPPYYGRGMRWYAMVKANPLRRVDLWVRFGAWIYKGQDRYSSGLQEINGTGDPATGSTLREDLKVQLRWRF